MYKNYGYTIVQHSGYAYGLKSDFKHGLEAKVIGSKPQLEDITKHGGLIFPTFQEAEDYAHKEMYPAGHEGWLPKAPGTFSDYKRAGLALYIPLNQPTNLKPTNP